MAPATLHFVTMAFGPAPYLRQAESLALSLRRNMPGHPIALITDRPLRARSRVFDYVIPLDPTRGMGTVQKVYLYDYAPFDECLFIDADSIVVRPFPRELAELRAFSFTPVVSRYLRPGDHDPFLDDLDAALRAVGGDRLPSYNGGVYYWRRSPSARQVFDVAQEILRRAAALGIKNFDRAGPGDETLFALALAKLGRHPLYDDHGRLMRTPLGIAGKLDIDVLAGHCSFLKAGRHVSPAICHFCGTWSRHPSYRLSAFALRHERHPHALRKLGTWTRYHAAHRARRMLRRVRALVR
jgi:hypothetical protein